ncbi:50S ribosomal protein L17 [Rikenella microfusus]|uniref:Large ribosomal subunit protein bL17 n=1 Tax=Rikenella microfusus TaxID=28139 RepID=A0A379MRV9_9BACT|nr:50S ribosomal protein L17 [Rikenella microfusus]SUE33499.1 50S ribosomal protein L17 [Rikenella microfusus]
MRHNRTINHLGRQASHRKALMANMAASLILHKRINTTVAKAKALRTFVEPIITKSKDDSTHSRRMVFAYLKNKQAVAELFRGVAPKIADRPGGYCRILKTGFRQGDGAETCFIELVDFNGEYTQNAGAAKKTAPKGRTRRAGGAKKAAPAAETAAASAETAAPAAAEAPVAETAETKAE